MEPGFISNCMSINKIYEFRLQSASPLSLKNHPTLKFVFNVMFCKSTDLVLHLFLNHNDQHFHCIIQQFSSLLETDDCDSRYQQSGANSSAYKFNSKKCLMNSQHEHVIHKLLDQHRLNITLLSWLYFYTHCTVVAVY